jgi:hypothetical protein
MSDDYYDIEHANCLSRQQALGHNICHVVPMTVKPANDTQEFYKNLNVHKFYVMARIKK